MIQTPRLIMRRWRDADAAPFHAIGQDVEVMRYLGPPISLIDAQATGARQNANADEYGSCFWAVERNADNAFLGFCGVKPGAVGTPIEGQPEIGWRLARHAWGQGYAREAAQACIEHAWATTDWPRVVAITVPANIASWGLMIRLGMTRVADGDFDHPVLREGNPLRRHMTYTIARPE